jgi:hypothetical protein
MAEHIKVTLEHDLNGRYHAIKHGTGRRPAAVSYGKFRTHSRRIECGHSAIRSEAFASPTHMTVSDALNWS